MKLTKPNCIGSDISNLSSFCFCLFHVLPYINQAKYTYEEIMGYTGHAFHINVRVEAIDKWGPTMYDWDGVIPRGLHNLGLISKDIAYSGYHMEVPNVLNNSIALIRQSIDKGVPLIMWEPLGPEFGIIYGYNDESQSLYVIDAAIEGEIPFDRIGRGDDTPEFYVLSIDEVINRSPNDRIMGTLDLILKYGLTDAHDTWEFSTGLPAYDAWIIAFNNKKIDFYGNSFNIQVLKNARESAIGFLNKFKNEFIKEEEIELINQSKNSLIEAVKLINELELLFPYPTGGNPREDLIRDKAIQLLNDIKEKEKSALLYLKILRDNKICL
ncbi:hypothetical protein EHS13_17145 [Paenibacillus psychroresistens]|uniref:Uncharacterized protein n=1 Tax=Paenibacillus psychroresistens TaxID=1778678 RepID=A0A6B8RKV9_9BACL|nr:hypothetical protein [Paenibacillus psychroresistens]QGQ96487.1 hypothetical protein EHS13_17145 [Paenibacillus psychroresistens]